MFVFFFSQRGVDGKGCSLSLVTPSDTKIHSLLESSFSVPFSSPSLDPLLLSSAAQRASLAARIVKMEGETERRAKENGWFRKNAEEAGVEVDDNMLDEGEGTLKGGRGGRNAAETVGNKLKGMRRELKALIATEMRGQRFGKFLSSSAVKKAIEDREGERERERKTNKGKSESKSKRKKRRVK